jgi:hypothetical protein
MGDGLNFSSLWPIGFDNEDIMRLITLLALTLLLLTGCQGTLTVLGDYAKKATGKSTEILTVSNLKPKAGDKVKVAGLNLTKDMMVVIGDSQIPLEVVSDTEASFQYPSGIDAAALGASFLTKDKSLVAVLALTSAQSGQDIPKSDATADLICGDVVYQDALGHLKKGTKVCVSGPDLCQEEGELSCITSKSLPALDRSKLTTVLGKISTLAEIDGRSGTLPICGTDGQIDCTVSNSNFKAVLPSAAVANKVLIGQSLAGVNGTVPGQVLPCNSDGQSDCLTSASFVALDSNTFTSSHLRQGLSLGGITGTLVPIPQLCAIDGALSCLTSAQFPSLMLSGAAPKILSGHILGGISGSGIGQAANCTADNQIACLTSGNFPSISKSLVNANAAKILAGTSLIGVAGTLASCAADGDQGCYVSSGPMAAALTSGGAAKILAGQTAAGLSGTAALRPAVCTSDSQINCVAVSSFPAVDKVYLNTQKANFSDLLSIASITGALPDCNSDGASGCLLGASTYAAASVTAATSKIASGSTLMGLSGAGAVKPVDCSSDGQSACVTTASFPAVDSAIAASRVASGQVFGGISGTAAGSRPLDCASDGGVSCVTVSNYPAMRTSGAAAKIALGDNLGGVTGTASVRPSDCSSDGQTSCVAIATLPALDKTLLSANVNKVRAGFSIQGISGTLSDCSADGGNACVTTAAYPSINTSLAASKILQGQTLGAVAGTAPLRPANCSADGVSGCVAAGQFPSIDLLALQSSTGDIRSSLTLAGVTGTLADCSADAQTSCVAISTFPAALVASAAPKILTGQTLGGVSGSAPLKPSDCSNDGDASCVIGSGYRAAVISGSASKIILGQSVAAISGTVLAKPSDCAVDGAASCVATSNFPAIDKADKLSVANLSQIHSTITISGLQGTLGDCASDGQASCFVQGPSLASMISSGADAKLLTGQTLGGVNGSALPRPADCTSDGQNTCVTVNSFPAITKATLTSAADKFRTSLTLGGVTGTISDCTADNESDCTAVTGHPSVLKSSLTPALVKNGAVLAGVTGAYPSVTYPLASNTGTADLTSFSSQLTSDTAFEFFDSAGNRYTASGDSDLTAINVRKGVALENISLAGAMPLGSSITPGPLTEVYSSSPTPRITLKWQNMGSVSYLVVRKTKAPVDWSPTRNVSYTTGAQGTSTILYVGTATSFVDTTVATANSYHYAVFAFDSNYFYSTEPARVSDMLSLCAAATAGGTWVAVPGDLVYNRPDFCVMKYEAKNVSGVATSQALTTPWTTISQTSAASACSALGASYSLISNAQWLTLGANIFSVDSNWSGGRVGMGAVNVGHVDNNPATICESSANDALAYVQTDCTAKDSSGDVFNQKRTHSLSTGSVVWDLSGNVWDWTSLNMGTSGNKPYVLADGGRTVNRREFNALDAGFSVLSMFDLIPLNSSFKGWNNSWGSAKGLGMYTSGTSPGGAGPRGESYKGTVALSGIFSLYLEGAANQTYDDWGFRCVMQP